MPKPRKRYLLLNPDAPNLSYAEFSKRRLSIINEIAALQRKLSDVLSPSHTMMTPNGPSIVELQLATARERLTMLVARWELQQRRSNQP